MTVTRHDFRPALLYATTTETLIPWDWLAESRDSEWFMPDRERIDMLLRAINGDHLQVRDWCRFCGGPLRGGAIRIDDSSWETWSAQRIPLVEEARGPLREALKAVLREGDTAVAEILANSALINDGRVIAVREISKRGEIRDRPIAHSIGPALIFALDLVIDCDRSYRRQLRQCALPRCGRFALTTPWKKRGQPPNFYCSGSERAEHWKQQNRERAAAYRARTSVDRYRRRKSRSRARSD